MVTVTSILNKCACCVGTEGNFRVADAVYKTYKINGKNYDLCEWHGTDAGDWDDFFEDAYRLGEKYIKKIEDGAKHTDDEDIDWLIEDIQHSLNLNSNKLHRS